MTIVDLASLDAAQREQLAVLSFEAGARHAPEWLVTLDLAREQVVDASAADAIARVVVDDAGTPLAWIAAKPAWGFVWELHPLLVAVAHQRRGLGRTLVAELEPLVAARGALTMWLGTSDSTGATSIGNIDLYADPLHALATLRAHEPHPVDFWQRMGYRIMGVVPDAEGPGKPSIGLAKRLR